MSRPVYADLHGMPEDERIKQMGRMVMLHGHTIACCVDNEPDKIERYKKKFNQRFPGIVIVNEFKGPTRGAYTIKLAPPKHKQN
jgi:dihydroorotase